jgi:hypothetical protein
MRKGWLLVAGTIVLVIAECLLFVYLVTGGWSFRALILPPGDPEIAVRTRTVYANGAWLALNLIGLVGYVSRRKGFGRSVILIVLAFDIMNSVFAATGFILGSDSWTAVQWFVVSLIPVAALVLVLLQPKAPHAPDDSVSP